MTMLSEDFSETLKRAQGIATEMRHEYTTLEHLLLALTSDKYAMLVFTECDINLRRLKRDLLRFLNTTHSSIVLSNDAKHDPKISLGIQRVLERSEANVTTHRLGRITGANVLLAMFSERDSHAIYYLQSQGMTRYQTVNFLAHGSEPKGPVEDPSEDSDESFSEPVTQNTADEPSTPKILEAFCIDVTRQAAQNKIDELIGRSSELQRLLEILCRRHKNNPLLVGDPGVGKTAIAEGLAHRIIRNDVPEPLLGVRLFSLDMGALLAGTRYRGDFEERFKGVIKSLGKIENSIVFIDEIHTVIGAGASSGSSLDASNMLKPSLAKGTLRCIGATTYKEYRQYFEKDRALLRRFQKVDVCEPSVEDSIAILNGVKKYYEEHHNVVYSADAIDSAARLSERYMHQAYLPDKALDVIDEAGAAQRLVPLAQRRTRIGIRDIERTIARMAQIPSQNITRDDQRQLKSLDRNLKSVLFGQEKAIHALVNSIKLSRAGLRNETRPVGCFLFTGPTGVGKTEASRQLAENMSMKLIRFDMSEYMERHSVSRLIGAPPGYVGYDQGGLLTDAVDQNPHAVLLLDEIEKSHPDIFNILLQIMDYGRLTDSNGKSVDFRHVILIMTSNVGEQIMERPPVGFARQERTDEDKLEIQRLFTPEFRNRLDSIIRFSHLSRDNVRRIVDKELIHLAKQLEPRRLSLTVKKRARNWLANKGYNRSTGARPLARLIETQVKQKLAEHILFGRRSQMKQVTIDLKGRGDKAELTLQISSADLSALEKPRPSRIKDDARQPEVADTDA